MTAMQLTKERIDSGDYTQDELLDWHEMANDPVHINSLSKLPKESFENITTYRENNYEYTMGERDGINVIIDVRSTLFDFQKPDPTKVKKDFSNMVEGVQNFASSTRFGLVKAYNNAKTILNEASGGRLKQFEDIVNAAGKNLFDIDVKIPIESLRPENDTLGSMMGEITGQYIIPGAFVYKYIPNILLAEPVVVGLFSGKDDGNLANVFQEFFPEFTENNKIANIIANGLATNENDDEVSARIKNIVADSPIGIFADTIFRSLKYFKNNPDKLEEVQNEFKDAGAAATPEELKKNFTSTQPFYSNVVNAIRDIDIPEGGMDVTQFTNTIRNTPGVKQSELDDMGFDGFFLDDQPAIVTQERVNEFLETKDLSKNVNTTVLGEADNPNTNVIKKDTNAIDVSLTDVEDYDDATLIVMNNERLYNEFEEFKNNKGYSEEFEDDAMEDFLSTRGIKKETSTLPTKFDDYVLPGGEDYKEMLLTSKGTQIFTKDHFRRAGAKGVPEGENVLAHIRFNTRDIDGKKVLFIEEIQSDLHQTGRRLGYTNKKFDIDKTNAELTRLFERKRSLEANINSLPKDEYNATKALISEIDQRYNQLINQRESFVTSGRIPDAPFKKNWHELSMKRIIKYAIDNGFEGISFTPASVQAERYPGEAGESLATFYDTILPKFVNKFSKKYGAKLENAKLGDEVAAPTYFDDVVDAPKIDEDYMPSDDYILKIEKSSFGEGFDLLENDQFINKYETFEKAQEGFINLYNDIRADDYLDPIKTQEVPYLEFTPEMINTIKSEGVPVAAVKDRETSATRTV